MSPRKALTLVTSISLLGAGLLLSAGGKPATASTRIVASTTTRSVNVRVTCVKRRAVKPPPRGVVRAKVSPLGAPVAGQSSTPHVILKPVCRVGQVPVVHPYRRGLPKGYPGQPAGRAGTARAVSPRAACNGVIYPTIDPNECFYYGGASDSRTAQGGGLTTKIEKPKYNGSGGPGHSLEEMSVQGGPSNGNIVEIGSSVSTDQFGNSDPHLFVYHWLSWAQTCYSCNWVQWSSTYYPNMDLSAFVGKSVYNGYVYYQGNWWAWFNDQWLGYFSGSLWNGQFTTSSKVQWFGEVATQNGLPPKTQMGDGLFPANPAAAPMSTMCDVDAPAWVCYYYDQQATYQTYPSYYGVLHTAFGAIRLGGSGL
jgi:hypothetical protein